MDYLEKSIKITKQIIFTVEKLPKNTKRMLEFSAMGVALFWQPRAVVPIVLKHFLNL